MLGEKYGVGKDTWLEALKEAAFFGVALKVEPETGLGAGGVFSWGSLGAEVREEKEGAREGKSHD